VPAAQDEDLPVDESAAEAAGAEAEVGAAATETDRSWLVFFDQTATLCSLFPGIAARVDEGEEAVGLFGNLTKKEMMGLVSEPAGSIRKASKETARRASDGQKSPGKSAAVSLSATGTTDAFGMSNGKSPKSGVVQPPPPPRLTAENLQKIGKTASVKTLSERRSLPGASEGTGSKTAQSRLRREGDAVPEAVRQAIPDFWQVGVRRNLRRSLEDKTVRQVAIRKRVEAMRREVEGT
jgi:hypothetical protein